MSCGETVYLKAKVPKVLVAQKVVIPQNTTAMQLQAVSHQPGEGKDTAYKVSVHKWSTQGEVQLAFIFPHKTPSSSKQQYILKVDGDKLKLEQITAGKKTNEPKTKYLFKWHSIGAGSWRRLQAVSASNQELFFDLQDSKVSLSSTSTQVFQLTSNGTTNIDDGKIQLCSCWRNYLKDV